MRVQNRIVPTMRVTHYGQKELVHVAVRSWISTNDNSSINDVLPRKMLSRSGLGILAHGIENPWTRPDSYFESAQEEVIVRGRLGD